MMSNELEKALEDMVKLDECLDPDDWAGDESMLTITNRIIAALREAIKQQSDAVAYQFQDREGAWCNFSGPKHYEATVADGTWPIRALYTSSASTIPAEKRVTVDTEGVRFGDCWMSHESITGCSAEQLNAGMCGVIGKQYMRWVKAMLFTAPKPGESND
jgi:hypothetical protein